MLRKIGTLTVLLASLAAFGQGRKSKKAPLAVTAAAVDSSVNYRQAGAPMPSLRVVTSDHKVITDKDVANDANLFVMLFNPGCEHCQNATIDLEKNLHLFKKSKILLVAAESMMPYLDMFNGNTNYRQYPSIQVGIDSSGFIKRTYSYYALPQINIYSPDRKLIRYFCGELVVDSLKPYIQ